MLKIFSFILILFALFCAPLIAAHFENPIDLTVKIEDGSFNLKIKDFNFNGEVINLDPSDMFKPRKVFQLRLQPGRYPFNWTTEKSQVRWSEEPQKFHEKIIVLEHGDSQIRINIKGDTITMY